MKNEGACALCSYKQTDSCKQLRLQWELLQRVAVTETARVSTRETDDEVFQDHARPATQGK